MVCPTGLVEDAILLILTRYIFLFSGDVGGALGLWIGATVVTVFEVIVVLMNPNRFLHNARS